MPQKMETQRKNPLSLFNPVHSQPKKKPKFWKNNENEGDEKKSENRVIMPTVRE